MKFSHDTILDVGAIISFESDSQRWKVVSREEAGDCPSYELVPVNENGKVNRAEKKKLIERLIAPVRAEEPAYMTVARIHRRRRAARKAGQARWKAQKKEPK